MMSRKKNPEDLSVYRHGTVTSREMCAHSWNTKGAHIDINSVVIADHKLFNLTFDIYIDILFSQYITKCNTGLNLNLLT